MGGSLNGILPASKQGSPQRIRHFRVEPRRRSPGARQRVKIGPDSDRQPSMESGAKSGGFDVRRALDRNFQDVGEELAQPIVCRHGAIDPDGSGRRRAIRLHRRQ